MLRCVCLRESKSISTPISLNQPEIMLLVGWFVIWFHNLRNPKKRASVVGKSCKIISFTSQKYSDEGGKNADN